MFSLGYTSFYRRASGVIARKFRSRVNLLDLLRFLTIKKIISLPESFRAFSETMPSLCELDEQKFINLSGLKDYLKKL